MKLHGPKGPCHSCQRGEIGERGSFGSYLRPGLRRPLRVQTPPLTSSLFHSFPILAKGKVQHSRAALCLASKRYDESSMSQVECPSVWTRSSGNSSFAASSNRCIAALFFPSGARTKASASSRKRGLSRCATGKDGHASFRLFGSQVATDTHHPQFKFKNRQMLCHLRVNRFRFTQGTLRQ